MGTPRLTIGGLALLSCLFVSVSASAPAVAQSAQRVPVEQVSTEQKARFVENLVTRSVSAQTIEGSGDEEAKRKLAEARSLVDLAKANLAKGRAEDANEKLDQALRLVNAEARRLSQSEVKGARQKDEYDRRQHAVRTFLTAYDRVARDKELSSGATAQMAKIRELIKGAEDLARDGRMDDANDTLENAYRMARGDIREMRDGETLTRSLDFTSPEEEYRYEHDRNDSHIMLLQFAINEKSPPASRLTRIEQLRQEAMVAREKAEAQARAGEPVVAIEVILRSTDTLLKAIRMSGVWVPG